MDRQKAFDEWELKHRHLLIDSYLYAFALMAFNDGFDYGIKASNPLEPAASMQDDSPRMMAIGQNGNNGEHYE